MANREWNPKSFFRHLTPDALEVLLEWAAVELTLDGEGPVGEQVYRGWKALPEAERVAIETKLLPVNDLCGPHARPYLERLAQQVWTNGHAHLVADSRAWSAQDLAVRLFVADEGRFLEAHQAHALDMMEHLTEFHGRYPVTLKPTAEAKTAMKAAMVSGPSRSIRSRISMRARGSRPEAGSSMRRTLGSWRRTLVSRI